MTAIVVVCHERLKLHLCYCSYASTRHGPLRSVVASQGSARLWLHEETDQSVIGTNARLRLTGKRPVRSRKYYLDFTYMMPSTRPVPCTPKLWTHTPPPAKLPRRLVPAMLHYSCDMDAEKGCKKCNVVATYSYPTAYCYLYGVRHILVRWNNGDMQIVVATTLCFSAIDKLFRCIIFGTTPIERNALLVEAMISIRDAFVT